MVTSERSLKMEFKGEEKDRSFFLKKIRLAVIKLTGEQMKLDALINEIAKNIFDHAGGKGELTIEHVGDSFEFRIKDYGEKEYSLQKCLNHSTLAGNGVNFGQGLSMILDFANTLNIIMIIDTSKGFSYSGTYNPKQKTV